MNAPLCILGIKPNHFKNQNKENFDWQIDSWHFDEIIIGGFKECKQQVCDLGVKNKHRLKKQRIKSDPDYTHVFTKK